MLIYLVKIRVFLSTLFLVLVFSYSSLADSYPPDFSDLSARLSPAVVSISTTMSVEPNAPGAPKFPPGSPFEDFFNDFFEKRGGQRPPRERRPQQAMGSGFIIDSSGLIVTNNHVIEDAISINVILTDNRSFKAKLVGKDKKTDLALLKIDVENSLPTVEWGDSDTAKVGNWVLAIGNPFGLVNTVTAGIISARGRDISAGPFDDFIQTDASINRGNSGGPLFNLNGEVVGINTAIFSPSGGSVGIGFSVPSNLAKSVIFQLEKYGKTKRGWLGVRIQTVTDDIAASLGLNETKGALISGVMPDGPAKLAGIKSGDVIIKFDNKNVDDMRSLPRIVAETEIDKPVSVEVWRNGMPMKLQVIVGEMIEEQDVSAKQPQNNNPESLEIEELGLLLSDISEDFRAKFNIPRDLNGVLILNVRSDTDASDKGILPGDIILEISQNKVFTPSDVEMRVNEEISSSRDFALLLINRKGTLSYIALKLSKE
ncbi:MAG: Periplasmic pH-dependent serine endoprotease DegQ [Alphaproteobacteria bacterium MarineAlpha9_Bin3]|nr:MAG: Periplasmic pH-dependent serine endoprotease DegQ [Alphaproteobacteria bacterium MarineAlpha9_Bin3]|tara:strand:+ start:887 stop:2338 length:1452 start_codon:yes stop_codon:yes gene_type:complete